VNEPLTARVAGSKVDFNWLTAGLYFKEFAVMVFDSCILKLWGIQEM